MARSNEGNYGATQGAALLYKSVDSAEHWTQLTLPKDVNGPRGLAIDPRDNRRIYLAAWGQEHKDVDVGGGVYLTTDGGVTWKPIFVGSQHVYDVTVDPKSPDNLYISGFDAGAWRSTDAGVALDAHSWLQLQMGPQGDRRSARRVEDLHHHLRQQRMVRSRGR